MKLLITTLAQAVGSEDTQPGPPSTLGQGRRQEGRNLIHLLLRVSPREKNSWSLKTSGPAACSAGVGPELAAAMPGDRITSQAPWGGQGPEGWYQTSPGTLRETEVSVSQSGPGPGGDPPRMKSPSHSHHPRAVQRERGGEKALQQGRWKCGRTRGQSADWEESIRRCCSSWSLGCCPRTCFRDLGSENFRQS